jgi:hypothetical protein
MGQPYGAARLPTHGTAQRFHVARRLCTDTLRCPESDTPSKAHHHQRLTHYNRRGLIETNLRQHNTAHHAEHRCATP